MQIGVIRVDGKRVGLINNGMLNFDTATQGDDEAVLASAAVKLFPLNAGLGHGKPKRAYVKKWGLGNVEIETAESLTFFGSRGGKQHSLFETAGA